MVWRPFYFGRIVVDPEEPRSPVQDGLFDDRLGGRRQELLPTRPARRTATGTICGSTRPTPRSCVGGDDGGLWTATTAATAGGRRSNLPVSQFYHVSTDNKDPYQVYGGLQDNSAWVGDQEYPGGITNSRWENLLRRRRLLGVRRSVRPELRLCRIAGRPHRARSTARRSSRAISSRPRDYKEKLRFNWNTPIALSPNEKGTIYIGSQFLFRSRDHGVTWDRISPDLSTNDPIRQRQEQSGGITVDNSARPR